MGVWGVYLVLVEHAPPLFLFPSFLPSIFVALSLFTTLPCNIVRNINTEKCISTFVFLLSVGQITSQRLHLSNLVAH